MMGMRRYPISTLIPYTTLFRSGSILSNYRRAMIFGGPQTIQQYAGNERVQVHGPGFSKILLGDDEADNWRQYIDLMVDRKSTRLNSSHVEISYAVFCSKKKTTR